MKSPSETLDRLRGVAMDTPDTHMALIDGRELLALVELAEVLKRWSLEPCDDHSTLTEAMMCQALAKLEGLSVMDTLPEARMSKSQQKRIATRLPSDKASAVLAKLAKSARSNAGLPNDQPEEPCRQCALAVAEVERLRQQCDAEALVSTSRRDEIERLRQRLDEWIEACMRPNDHHPGPRCSCAECLRKYPEAHPTSNSLCGQLRDWFSGADPDSIGTQLAVMAADALEADLQRFVAHSIGPREFGTEPRGCPTPGMCSCPDTTRLV